VMCMSVSVGAYGFVSQITAYSTAATFSRVVSRFKRHEISLRLRVLLRSVDF